MRSCLKCGGPLSRRELLRGLTRALELDRRASGLGGLRFRCFACPRCGADDIFLDLIPQPGEREATYQRRWKKLEPVAQAYQDERTRVAVTLGPGRGGPASNPSRRYA